MKAYFTYMSDREFVAQVKLAKQSHERFVTAILQCDVFPNLDKVSPLEYPEEDDIPARFGSDYLKYKNRKSFAEDNEEVKMNSGIDK